MASVCLLLSNPGWFVSPWVTSKGVGSSEVCQDGISSTQSSESIKCCWPVSWTFVLNGDQNDFAAGRTKIVEIWTYNKTKTSELTPICSNEDHTCSELRYRQTDDLFQHGISSITKNWFPKKLWEEITKNNTITRFHNIRVCKKIYEMTLETVLLSLHLELWEFHSFKHKSTRRQESKNIFSWRWWIYVGVL